MTVYFRVVKAQDACAFTSDRMLFTWGNGSLVSFWVFLFFKSTWMKNVCLYITVKSRWPGQYYMYISILIKINNHRIGFLFPPFVKRSKNVVSCIEILLKPKSSSEGLTQLRGYLAQSISFCDSDAKRRLGICSWRWVSARRFHIDRLRSATLNTAFKGRSEYSSWFFTPVLNFGYQTKKEKKERKRS